MECGMSTDSTLTRLPSEKRIERRSFVYEPLQSARHIRLLRIPATTSNASIEELDSQSTSPNQESYEIVITSLDNCEHIYQAISYVWDDSAQDHSIKINGKYSLPITKTLAVGLPQLAKICSTRFLWIDQICIDQSNNQERGRRVLIMGEIYRNAESVLIWTGGKLDGLSEMKTRLSQLLAGDRLENRHTETLT